MDRGGVEVPNRIWAHSADVAHTVSDETWRSGVELVLHELTMEGNRTIQEIRHWWPR